MYNRIEEVERIECLYPISPDDVFICCASWEERCLGTLRIFSDYMFRNGYLFIYDKPNEQRDSHLEEMRAILGTAGTFDEIPTSKDNPIPAISQLKEYLRDLNLTHDKSVITIDITTFTKQHLLFLLRVIDDMDMWSSLRIFYSEPENYIPDLRLPMSTGIRQISAIPGFVCTQPLTKPALLVIFLGYEGDRATALFENLDPNEVILVVPEPPYHEEWRGRTEDLNRHLITLIGKKRIKYANSLDPFIVASDIERIIQEYNIRLAFMFCSIRN